MSQHLSYSVAGLSCTSCVGAVTKKLQEIDAIDEVSVDLNSGGLSTVTVTSTLFVDETAARAAIDDAGFDVVDLVTQGSS